MWTALAVFLYLLPIAGFWLLRFGGGRSALCRALDLPIAVALDLVLVLLAARFVVLDHAALLVRAVELLGLAWLIARRRRAIWHAFSWRQIAVGPLLAGLLALWLSWTISDPYAIWDRQWHIPLTASLRGQNTPFSNVYEPGQPLFYHYGGNALAAVFQALSFSHMHASAALSRVHDVIFALTGLLVGLVLRGVGAKGGAAATFTVLCMLAGGPATVLLEGTQRWATGRSTVSLLSLSFRPHDPLAYLFAVTFLVASLAPLLTKDWMPRRSMPALMLSASVMALNDELTLAILFGTMGVAWLFAPRDAVGGWRDRLLVLLSPIVSTGLTIVLFGGTFSLGAPHQSIEVGAWRLPGFYITSLPLSGKEAWYGLLSDYLGPIAIVAATAIGALGRRDGRGCALLLAHVAFVVASLGLLVFVRLNRGDLESHRAVTGIGLLSPLLLALWYARLPEGEARGWMIGIGGVACLFGVVSTFEWLRSIAPIDAPRLRGFWGDDRSFYSTNCVKETGARLGERALPSVGPTRDWYLFAGCRPVFSPPSSPANEHAIAVGWPATTPGAFELAAAWRYNFPNFRVFFPVEERNLGSLGRSVLRLQGGECKAAGKFIECVYGADAFAMLAKRR